MKLVSSIYTNLHVTFFFYFLWNVKSVLIQNCCRASFGYLSHKTFTLRSLKEVISTIYVQFMIATNLHPLLSSSRTPLSLRSGYAFSVLMTSWTSFRPSSCHRRTQGVIKQQTSNSSNMAQSNKLMKEESKNYMEIWWKYSHGQKYLSDNAPLLPEKKWYSHVYLFCLHWQNTIWEKRPNLISFHPELQKWTGQNYWHPEVNIW